jgi:hypothetical protein
MSPASIKRALMVTTVLVVGAAGCELISDFDRTKIPGGGFDGSVDAPGLDVTPLPTPDVVQDVANDSPAEAASDASDGGATDGDATTTSDAADGGTDADDAGEAGDADDSG